MFILEDGAALGGVVQPVMSRTLLY